MSYQLINATVNNSGFILKKAYSVKGDVEVFCFPLPAKVHVM